MSSSSVNKRDEIHLQSNNRLVRESLIYHRKDLVRANITSDEGISLLDQQFDSSDNSNDTLIDYVYNCCKLTDTTPANLDFIPYKNVLNVEVLPNESDEGESEDSSNIIEVTYALPPDNANHDLKISKVKLELENQPELPTNISQFILSKSYKNNLIRPKILVLINPHGGQGNAKSIYKHKIMPVLQAADVKITYIETKYHGHATEIARDLDINSYDIIVCCSGDGIPHEVINGFFLRPDKGLQAFNKIAVTQLPCGSGNALTLSTHGTSNPSVSTFRMLKAHKAKLDLMAVTQGTGNKKTTKLSFLSQCYGIIADSDIGTEHLRWLGPVRFEIGIAQKVFGGAKYPCELYVKEKISNKSEILNHVNDYLTNSNSNDSLPSVTEENLTISGPELDEPVPDDWKRIPDDITHNLNILYVGKMPYVSADAQFFPAALPSDGAMDMIVTDSNNSIWKLTSILLAVEKGDHIEDEKVHHVKVLSYRLIPNIRDGSKHYISIDGEDFPFEPFQVEILPGVLTGLLQDGNFVETSVTK
ncbi:LCB5 Sphingoid long chain base kinase 5 [Candida maltosa Xu316]|uniref:DAGKc domain-containing protein n=1 Tax=Candida maltosa (strain Xu316) TaxID=1245528 RepID=M3K2P2_CANMX|nr:hypothetical protein G210_5664 [Candida maltosa Xu316]